MREGGSRRAEGMFTTGNEYDILGEGEGSLAYRHRMEGERKPQPKALFHPSVAVVITLPPENFVIGADWSECNGRHSYPLSYVNAWRGTRKDIGACFPPSFLHVWDLETGTA